MPACHPCRTLTLLRCLVLGGCLLLVGGADECGSSNVCTAAGQICNDPDPAVPNNWVCSCAGSGSGTQVGAKATCTYTGTDCAMNMIFCRQTACDDPDGTMDGNWRCACPPPQRTVKYGDVMTSAECEMDECLFAANAGVCSAVGQSCNDPDKSTTRVGDWTCNCATGTGSATAAAATCTATGECVANEATCAAAKQACEDPSTMATGDWQCVCVAPTTGAPRVGGVATCTLDECAVACPTCAYDGTTDACAAKGQQCKDPDTSVGSTGDWACFLDECLTMSTMCTGTQVCSDPNTAPTSTNDWTCSCVLPQTGSATAGAATCVQDECTEAAKGTVCSNAGQQCEDPNTATASLGDYTCKCVLPSTGTPGTATPATCMGQGGCATSASTCTDVGQFCTPATMGFKCICLSPSTGTPGDSAPAACTLDECTTVCPTCADTGSGSQCGAAACTDPNTSAQSTGDWSCALDECTKNGATCTAASQTCSDPKPASNSLADWECQCTAPATGSAVAGVATCSEDECIVSAATCPMGQTCNDPDKTKAGDWTCNCDAPTTGSSTASAATCEEDECVASGNTCTTAAQECKDPNKATTSKGDWTCNCIAPATGVPVTVAAATCTQVGECVANAKTCTDASQTCDDPDMAVMGDWQCKCIAPATGFAVAGVATCTVDECVANAATCPMGQTCNDPDKTKAGDWTCNCDAPTTGSSIASAATCEEDECVANGNTCTTAAQECKDPNKATTSKGDWACNCIAPATGVPVKAAAATCTQVGECVANAKTCTDASQTCEDPDMAVMGDWQCKCIAPATGFAVAGVATCTVDECVANAATCPMGQTCNDPDKTKAGDWTCNCDAPTTGSSIASAATCEEDECVANGNTCTTAAQECKDPNKATTSKGDWTCNCIAPATGAPVTAAAATCTQVGECVANAKTCTDASQTCEDPDMAVMGDWQCKCIAPATGFAVAGVATCTVDECVANAATCPMGQTCNDPDKTKAGDWTCNCDAPTTGSSIASAATCEEDECVANGNTCTTAAQECKDPNKATTSKGDWTCNCIAPATGAPVTAAAATCTQVGECVANAKTCTDAAQTCEDPDMAVMGDWQCKCIAPATGFAVAGVATCTVDECVANAATCPMAQTCNDPDKTKAGDWTCNCDAPTTGSSIASAATCEEDECVANGNTCTTAAQECKDPNKATTSKGDWTCNCIAPATGAPVTAAAATCTQVGECLANAKTCTDASQSCDDPDMAVMGDWQCKCIAPATGFAVAGVATCTVDECVTNAATCPMGQTCSDPDNTKAGDWTCNCDAPTTGSSTASAATCEEDECVANGNTCTTAAQECKDPNKATTSKGDWTCNCIAPATGVPVKGAVATCAQVGECVANAKTCTDASQSCDDPDVAVMGDWQCKCIAPATGFAVAGVAKCTEDECVANAGTCTVVGQTCNDPDQTSAGDWLCVCPAPSVATGTAAPAPSCDVDECVDNAGVCAAAGQSCDDPNKSPSSLMDWTCNCMLPATGKLAIGAPTACTDTGSCVANSPVCKAANQSCSASMNGSWTCNCIAPAVGTGVESIAVCTSDECAASLALCPAGQDCVDPDPAVSGDWQCRCRSPHSGTATGGSANCTFDECAATGNAVCNAKGQMCEDPNPDPAVTGDWVCNCIPPATGTPGTAAPGNCTAVGECAVHLGECTAAGQTCNDPDVNTTDDWECVCIAPQTGTKKGGPAPCIVDECITNAATCTAAMQNCVDSNTSPNSTDDWVCNCVPPLVGSSPMAAVVSCSQSGECEGNNKMVCEAAGQVCFDPDAAVLGDWRCRCVSPTNGSAEGKAAACDLDECVQNRDTCSAQGQACVDSNMDAMSLNDWECRCVSPAAGMPGTASAAACVQVGECQTQGNLDICIAQNQSCNDPDPMVAGDWQCECISPQVGDPGKQAAAACGISECYDNEATCAAAGQACVDPDPTKQGDWKCSCIPPQVGSAATGPASCGTDECGSQGAVCTSKGQTCSDPDYSIANDFTCTCAGSGTGTGVGANASCSWVGECTTKYTICEGFGQACFDPDTNVKDDWECHCVAPQPNGTAVGKQAACGAPPPLGLLVDECDQNKDVCNSQGQECSDPDTNATSLGDWKCLCQHSGVGVQVAGAATCVHSDGCGMNSSDVCVLAGQACKSSSSSTFSCMCVGGKTGSQPGGAAVCSAAAPLTPGAGCSWDEETKCNDDHKCEWLVDKLSCAPRYCEQRTEKCELDPICERVVGTKECVRSRCGLFTTPDDCLAADNCVWMENLGGHMPLTGVPYPLSPAYCTHEGDPNDNSDLLHWLIIIAVILCLCATAAMYLATKLRARLQRKEEHREREEEMQRELLKPERELAELWRVQSHGAELGAELRKPVPDAPALARVRNADGNGQDQQNQADSEEEQEPEGNETERAQMLREQLERLKLKQAEQAIQSQQRGEAQGLERRKRQLELEMDKEENRKETQRQLDRAQASHALQFGVAQRKAARRQRERQREQELLLDVEKTQSLINQQRRRRDDLGSKTHELNELTADGKPVHTDGDLTDGELERQAQADSALETLLHGGGSAGGGGDSVAAAAPAPVVGNVLSPPSRGVARHRYPAQAVTLQTIHSEAPEDAAGSTTSSKDDDPKLMESVQKSHQPSEWDMRSNFKAGVGERKAAPVTDYKSHYDKLVSEIVEDKLSAGETRRSMDPELGASTSSPRPAGAAAAIPEAAMGPEWDALLTSVVKNSDAAGSYDAAHSSAPVLPRSPGDARRVTV